VKVFFLMLVRIVNRRYILILSGIILSLFLFVTCTEHENKKAVKTADSEQYAQFAGSAVCANCHQQIYRSHLQTAHYHTSAKTSSDNMLGITGPDSNRFYYTPDLYLAVENKDGRYIQAEYVDGAERVFAPMDITVGSGKRGQTFLYWYKNKLLQLPLTWFAALHQWTNSPGFSNRVIFRRPATSRCLECHSTFFQVTSADSVDPEDFSKTNILYGVDCEKCHGPAAKHVNFHRSHPDEKIAQYIVSAKSFSRVQSLDLCRLCHGGKLAKTQPSFSFQAGDKLADYFRIDTAQKSAADLDVHGNQYGMLAASKCFRQSEMTCITCHNPHENETGKKELFSQRCMSCHNGQHANFCKEKDRVDVSITGNCIDCHMPEQPSRSIMVLLQGENVPTSATMRSHFINIYPDATKKFLSKN